MKKRSLSLLLAIVMLLSLSTVAFADTTDSIPAEMYQKCVDDTPAGHYLADVIMHAEDDGATTTVEALYLPVSRTMTGAVTKNIYVYATVSDDFTFHALTYRVTANFNYTGTSVSLATSSCTKTYQCGNIEGYTVSTSSPVKQYGNGTLIYHIYYDVYHNGTLVYDDGYARGGISCDQNGNIGYI